MASVPNQGHILSASELTDSSVRLTSFDPGNNGSPITKREIYGQRTGTATATVHPFDLDYTWTGLLPGTLHRFWWRAGNAIGWGPYSDKLAITTKRIPDTPGPPAIKDITQNTFRASWSDPYDGGTGIIDRLTGVSLSATAMPTDVDTFRYHGSYVDVFGPLSPGRTYYVRNRVTNSIGASAWSSATVLHLVAGAFVKTGGLWKPAVPYVKVAGVWKVARPQGRILGIWEVTG